VVPNTGVNHRAAIIVKTHSLVIERDRRVFVQTVFAAEADYGSLISKQVRILQVQSGLVIND